MFPLACGGLLLLAITVAWFLNDPTRFQGSLVGELTASDAGTEVLVPRSIDPGLAEGHAKLYAKLIESLKEGTGRVRSNVMVVVFDESEGKLAVGIEPSQEYRLVRVALGQSAALGRFVESQSSGWTVFVEMTWPRNWGNWSLRGTRPAPRTNRSMGG